MELFLWWSWGVDKKNPCILLFFDLTIIIFHKWSFSFLINVNGLISVDIYIYWERERERDTLLYRVCMNVFMNIWSFKAIHMPNLYPTYKKLRYFLMNFIKISYDVKKWFNVKFRKIIIFCINFILVSLI